MNKIVIEFCAEDRARLDRISEALEKLAPVTVTLDVPELGGSFDVLPQQDDVAVGAVDPAPEAVPVISLADFQKAVVLRGAESPETKKKVVALISKYADCISNVPEDRRAEFLEELAKI